jgi:hypothetical protein
MFSWFNFGGLYVSRNLYIASWFVSLLECWFIKYSQMIFWISMVSVLISPFYLILLIWVFSFILLVNLAKVLLILFIFFREPTFCFIDSLYHSFGLQFIDYALVFIISFYLLLELACSCFSKSSRYIIRLFILGLSNFLMLTFLWSYTW